MHISLTVAMEKNVKQSADMHGDMKGGMTYRNSSVNNWQVRFW